MTLLANFTASLITGAARALTGARSLWLGCAPVPEQRIYFANHTSHSDFVLLWASLPKNLRAKTRPVAGADYWLKGAVRPFIINQVFHGVLVERNGGAAKAAAPDAPQPDANALPASDALAPLRAALDEGYSLILFPEGTRNMGEGLLPFKSGIYHLAKDYPHIDLVPVWLGNLNRVMPKGHLIPLPLLCTVNFGVPLRLGDAEEKPAFLNRLQQALRQLGGKEAGEAV